MAVSSALMLLAAGGTGSACAAKVTSASTDAAIWKTCLMGILPRVMKSLARLLLRGRRVLLYAASAEMISRDRRSCLSYQDIWGNTACERRDADGQEFGGDGCSIAKLLDLRLCAPFAESLRVERKLALTIKQLVCDLAHARGIFENHSIRSLEIEESRRGCGMSSRPEHHGYSAFGQEMKRTHPVVARGDLMVDVLDPRSVRRKQRDRVMDLVDTQQRRIADAIAHSGVADFVPERLIAARV